VTGWPTTAGLAFELSAVDVGVAAVPVSTSGTAAPVPSPSLPTAAHQVAAAQLTP